jgi:hypothetical protein
LDVLYSDVLADPQPAARKVSEFLGIPLDTLAMAAVVDPSLHHQRSNQADSQRQVDV